MMGLVFGLPTLVCIAAELRRRQINSRDKYHTNLPRTHINTRPGKRRVNVPLGSPPRERSGLSLADLFMIGWIVRYFSRDDNT